MRKKKFKQKKTGVSPSNLYVVTHSEGKKDLESKPIEDLKTDTSEFAKTSDLKQFITVTEANNNFQPKPHRVIFSLMSTGTGIPSITYIENNEKFFFNITRQDRGYYTGFLPSPFQSKSHYIKMLKTENERDIYCSLAGSTSSGSTWNIRQFQQFTSNLVDGIEAMFIAEYFD